MIPVLFSAPDSQWHDYNQRLPEACRAKGLDITLTRDLTAHDVEFIVYAPNAQMRDFSPYRQCRAVLSLWAGVERIVVNQTLTQPLVRLIDPGLTQGMVEWVTGHVLRHHLGMDDHICRQDGIWSPVAPPLAAERRVTVLGLGALGAACAQALATLGFPVTGWSRTAKQLDGITCLCGLATLPTALASAEIVVLLLPLTPETTDLMNAARLATLPKGAVIINPGRGPLIEDDALLAALASGHIGHATLDVFRTEPLPPDHPYWHHPRVTVTPHIASATRPATAVQAIAQSMSEVLSGVSPAGLVDRTRGY